MDKKTKRRWIKALKSGDYKQGQGCLRDADDHFCCIGVLADIVGPDAWAVHKRYVYSEGKRVEVAAGLAWREANTITVPNDILGFEYKAPLMRMNDTERQSFKQIAAWVKKNVATS